MWVETSLLEIRAEVAEKLRNFQCYHNFPGKVFVYWKYKEYFEVMPLHCFTCYPYIIIGYQPFTFCIMTVLRTWEANIVLRNVQWQIMKLVKNFES